MLRNRCTLTRRVHTFREMDFPGHWRVDFWYLKMKPSAHISVQWAISLEIWAISYEISSISSKIMSLLLTVTFHWTEMWALGFIFRYQRSTLQCLRKSVSRRVWTLLVNLYILNRFIYVMLH